MQFEFPQVRGVAARVAPVAALLLLVPAREGAAQWTPEIGGSCEKVIASSVEDQVSLLGSATRGRGFAMSLERELFGHPSIVSYLCLEGAVASHGVLVEVASEAEGRSVRSQWLDFLTIALGSSSHDADEGFVRGLSDLADREVRRVSTWFTGSSTVMLDLQESLTSGWNVSILETGPLTGREQVQGWLGPPNHVVQADSSRPCSERWLYKFEASETEPAPDAMVFSFLPDGRACASGPLEETVNIVQPEWAEHPLRVIYPMEALLENVEGYAIVDFRVEEDLTVTNLHVSEHTDSRFAPAAQAAFERLVIAADAFKKHQLPLTRRVKVRFELKRPQ